MTIKRFLRKSNFSIQGWFIGFLVYLNHRLYMRLYNALLRRQGFKLNGEPRFIAKSARFDDFERITLGDRIVISMNVHFLTHDYSLTTAMIATGHKPETDQARVRDIKVGDNVFIGMNVILLPGTTIGDHVIVGAGSVVRGNVPSNSIIAGNPAVVIGDIRDYAKKVTDGLSEANIRVDKQ